MTVPAEDILGFWLGVVGVAGWYEQDDQIDQEIRDRFETTWHAAAQGDLDHWLDNPHTALALCILLDQFPRNMFRQDAKAYSTDAKALAVANASLTAGHDLKIPEPERQFFYLPYMHSEDLTDQHACVTLIGERMVRGSNLYHAYVHRAIIERFGRFPYRNAVLARDNTEAERAYIAAGLYEPEGCSAPPQQRATIEAYLTVKGAKTAVDWYGRAFGASELKRVEAEDGARLEHPERYKDHSEYSIFLFWRVFRVRQ